jgi:predicted GIY-YIG superfamily endonuclease
MGNQKKSAAERYAETKKPCQLYRNFAADGSLLYVGISKNATRRGYVHKSESHWGDLVAKTTVENYPTRDAAAEAERRAITFEKPIFNQLRPWRPEVPKGLCPALDAIFAGSDPAPLPKSKANSKIQNDTVDVDQIIADMAAAIMAHRN